MKYASFWKRTAAYLVDSIIYAIGSGIVSWIITMGGGLVFFASGDVSLTKAFVSMFVSLTVGIACYIAYYVWPESTSWQATIGKKLFGLKVTDLNGQRISFWRSLGRNVGMILSWLILCIGNLMCLWTEKKQCLHDQIADCLVIDTTPNEKKVATVIVVALYGVLLALLLGIIAAVAIPQYNKSYNEVYGKTMEQMHFTQARLTLLDAQYARDEKERSTNAPVTRWDQLDGTFDCMVQSDPSVCKSEEFTYEIKKDVVSAKRNLEKGYYTLSIDKQGNTSCFSYDDENHLCKHLLP